MLKKRIIPILTFNGFALIKTKQFGNPRMVGNPVQSARVFNSREVDELVFVDILASSQKRKINLKALKPVINECFMPISIGGGIENLQDITDLLSIGADKVVIKTQALRDPSFIKEAVKIYGAQAIVIAVDVKKQNGKLSIHHFEPKLCRSDAYEFIKQMEDYGAGELCVTDVNQDGMMNGYDCDLFAEIQKASNLPLIASGGAGNPAHFVELLDKTSVTGVGAASIFYFTQYTPLDIKNQLKINNHPVRILNNKLSLSQ